MIHRFLCRLLVVVMLANQSLCFAHSHDGTDIAESESHASRSHFHLGGHDHHGSTNGREHDESRSHDDHSNRDQRSTDDEATITPMVSPIFDHDTDAVYCTESVAFARGRHSVVVSAKYVEVPAVLEVVHQNDDRLRRVGPLLGQPASVFDAACPIYLRTLSLRI